MAHNKQWSEIWRVSKYRLFKKYNIVLFCFNLGKMRTVDCIYLSMWNQLLINIYKKKLLFDSVLYKDLLTRKSGPKGKVPTVWMIDWLTQPTDWLINFSIVHMVQSISIDWLSWYNSQCPEYKNQFGQTIYFLTGKR